MSYKFVKVYCDHYKVQYDNWFLVIGRGHRLSWEDRLRLQKNMGTQLLREGLDCKDPEMKPYTVGRFRASLDNPIDYDSILEKYPEATLLVRENGSWMTLNLHHIITDAVYSETTDFPINNNAQVIICENDPYPEKWWVGKLEMDYPEYSIETLTNFFNRRVEDIRISCINAEVITFTTTFSRTDWFENLLKACDGSSGKTFVFDWKGGKEIWDGVYEQFQTQIDQLLLDNTIILTK